MPVPRGADSHISGDISSVRGSCEDAVTLPDLPHAPWDILSCPLCQGNFSRQLVCVRCGLKVDGPNGIPNCIAGTLPSDAAFSEEKWSELYRESPPHEEREKQYSVWTREIDEYFQQHGLGHDGHARFLEIGCGHAFLAAEMARRGLRVFGLDVCSAVLDETQRYFQARGLAGHFVRGTITHLPFRDGSFHLSYGGGVIEHIEDTQAAVRELYRVTALGGATFQTVPYASLGAILYRQRWGNIPEIPVLKQGALFLHRRVFAGRFMRFGYEKSFPIRTLERLFGAAGWSDITIRYFDSTLEFEGLTHPRLRSLLERLARQRWCWPMVYIVARKGKST